MKKAVDCTCITEVRNEIDRIDHALMKLLSERQEYVEEIVKYKTDKDSVVAADRQKLMYQARRLWAEELGLSPDFIEDLFRKLVKYNIERELRLLKK